jgi:acyl-coenzyme A synthetase/AMP-(fatty) acid ligase
VKDPLNIVRVLIDQPAARHPDRVAIAAAASCVTYAALGERTNRIGHLLRRLGCAPGDRVLLAVADSAELVAALLAAIKIGALAVPVPPGRSVDEYAFYLRDSGASIAIANAESIDTLLAATAIAEIHLAAIATEETRTWRGVHPWRRAMESTAIDLDTYPASPDAPALLLYTSGSTGQQKAAMHSHRAVAAATQHVGREAFGLCASDRVLSTARLFFSFGFGFGLCLPLAAGATTILHPTKDLRELARVIAAQRPTILCGVPSLLDVLLRASATWLDLDLSSVRFVVSAGEPLAPAVYDGYRDRFGLEVLDGIGSTEMLTHFITNRPGQSCRGSCGTPVAGCDVRLVDDEGRPVPDGQIGNLRVNGPTAFLGYWNRPEATARVRGEHGVSTGDTLFRDAGGRYHYCGRHDDMVKIAGLWVSPLEIQSVMCGHPDVEQCAVTTREDPARRRRLVAYIVGRSPCTPRPADLYRYAGEHLPDHMIPAAFVALPALPLTPNGKLKRSDLPEPRWTT